MGLLGVPFMRHVLIAGVLVALGLAPLSVYVVLRRIVFVGAAVAEISSAGVALAILVNVEPFAVAIALTIITFLAFSRAADKLRLPLEALIGMLYAGGAAAAVLLIARSPRGEGNILNVLFGNILTVPLPLLWAMVIAFGVVLAIQYLAYKEFLITAYDPDMARALGIRVDLWNTIFYVALGVAVAIAIRGVGALLTFTLLVAPGAAALCLVGSLAAAFSLATALGLVCTVTGIAGSYWLDLPTGPSIVALLAAAFGLSYIWSAIRGE
ncbi:MAG TPA: metal ABC transporter permease [Candidatus Binataceae bacterium]|jgi:ABC-type Mn2+/Zn2+ transport system permease subunit|nr:metal ABC transporter permease [Candidatus Binataceae bacterium]